ncbi:unnamed protein product [Prorocentrum cordatum]|uniref:Uncharacterized protein n=1 Tax=Prorocentrum cordatum TaxID=2364126 RepID=A0ABN9SWU9_9DINO|nr:unnamed protein product [Polarella glacialis]
MGAATAALSWLRPPATIVRGAPTPGSRRRRRTRLVAATTGGAVGQIRAAANRVGVGIAADGALAGCVRLHAHLRQGRLVAATTGGAVGQIRAAANRVGVGIAPMEHLLDAFACTSPVPRPPCVGPALSQQPLAGQSDKSGQRPIGLEWGSQPMEHLLDAFACTCTCAKAALSQQPLAGQSDKSGQRPIGLEWGSQPMEHSLDAFTARATLASARRSCARPTSSQPSSAAQVPSSARAAAEQTTSALNASLPRAMIQWILLNRG